ncbi:PHP domain-containing protein [Chitinasiproducens palmae]|uniref:Polymerase/histidinol phosphatase N-terminal domain-containing protein n=1 Tax=Chitinasiproducens palmae TaxID=1770053 RepID=A0A1H2PSX9_9BURK|nr:PHP domain-containing protein [Chitinasiproducens palmae]SDV49299.1 hypothetical protein SAMN05216551_107224 [Chitinasiproducens palmae]
MPSALNADLHCHSTASDGTLAPAAVAALAARNGVALWSLTDHDELSGQAEAAAAARRLGMRYLPGVEISVTWAGRTVHIVGMNVDPTSAVLNEGLVHARSGRTRRAQEIGERLASLGIAGAFDGALAHVGNPDLISRTHFARWMVERGVVADLQTAFSRYLGDGRAACVPHRWSRLADAVGWILASGGAAIVAHPGRYDFTPLEFDVFFGEFRKAGGTAIEVVTGSHTPDQYDEYADVARHYGFLASRGSDFHGPGETRAEPGTLPALPRDLTPVWAQWL